jgi:type I restriction enzyme M protein
MAKPSNGTSANLGFESKLWAAADLMRGHMDAAEYKHVVLGLLFLKYISDSFQEHYEQLKLWTADPDSEYYVREERVRYEVAEDPDEYLAKNLFFVPAEARWSSIQANAKQPGIGKLIDDAMDAVERANPSLKGVLTKDYARPTLNKQRLGELIDLISTVSMQAPERKATDIMGRAFEYFLERFAAAEGKRGGEFYTPQSVVRLLVEMLEPYKGRIYDPCCGSGGMFVQSEKFVEAHGGNRFDISIYGQESNPTTWKLCKMNLAIRGISGNLGQSNADTFLNDLHKDLRADFILANPPFNMKEWGAAQLAGDVRWRFGQPPANNANYAWMQHMIYHLAPDGKLGLVLANGSMSTNTGGEGEIRKKIIEADLVDCIVALPGQLFYTTQIPVCLWFISRSKAPAAQRDRRGETLFIDARQMGQLVDRTHRELSDDDLARIVGAYHAWQGQPGQGAYEDVSGFCKAAKLEEIRSHDYVLTPGRYVGAADVEDEDETFEFKMDMLIERLSQQLAASEQLVSEMRTNLSRLGYGI